MKLRQNQGMGKKAATPTHLLSHRWYLPEWAVVAGKTQADAIREIPWSRSTASQLWTGKQPYNQERVDQAAKWLGLAPHELLLPPEAVKSLRQLQSAAEAIVQQGAHPRTGTGG